ncbi:MAG: FHA domain-containing protein [Chloroflexota bacterium]|nr:MAG: hypothetical protein KatS3mg047_0399 [Bellilinea sp.]
MAARYQLVLKSGPNAGLTYPVEGDLITIGRDASNMLVVNDPEVSRRHARIYRQGDKYYLEDLGSTNGTAVNGVRLDAAHALRGGELITLGENTHLLFEAIDLDPDATIAAVRSSLMEEEAAPRAAHEPVITTPPPMSGSFSGQVPEPVAAKKSIQSAKKKLSPLVIVLIVGVIVLACGCIAFAIFDALNLYCTPPFNTITNLFIPGACPP